MAEEQRGRTHKVFQSRGGKLILGSRSGTRGSEWIGHANPSREFTAPQVVSAVKESLAAFDLQLTHFTLAPHWGEPPGYQLYSAAAVGDKTSQFTSKSASAACQKASMAAASP